MNTRFAILLSLFAILATSCVSKKELNRFQAEPVENFTFTSGIYSNCTPDTCTEERYSLIHRLDRRLSPDTFVNWEELTVGLSKVEPGLFIEIHRGERTIDRRLLKGKWDNNRFTSRRKILPMGIPPIFYVYYEKVVSAEFLPDSVCVLEGLSQAAIVLILSGGNNDYRGGFYEEISEPIVSDTTGELSPPREFSMYLAKHLEIEDAYESEEPVAKIYIQFTIAADGSVKDAKLIHPESVRLTNECRQKFLEMPNWTPGRQDGEPVEMKVTLPVNINWR